MDTRRIAELLQPFFAAPVPDHQEGRLSQSQLQQISTYIDLLIRWNARVNLTAVREPENIVTRHFGESLFAARCLFASNLSHQDGSIVDEPTTSGQWPTTQSHLIDFGSGAGFPGLPIKIWEPGLRLTLVESNHKKATFLREVARALQSSDVEVVSDRAENYRGPLGDVLTLRAVERFEKSLPVALRLVGPSGRLALLIGESQVPTARATQPDLNWKDPVPIPLSQNRVLLIGSKPATDVPPDEPK